MQIRRIRATNFMSFENLDLEFPESGLVLVDGKNGAGKSSIFDAVCYAMFGTTQRGIGADELITVGKSYLMVVLDLVLGNGAEVTIVRARNSPSLGTCVQLVVDGERKDLPSDRETQKLINTMLGLDRDLYCCSVYVSQRAPGFSSLTDAEQKEVLGTILGFERLDRAAEAAKEARTNAQARISDINIRMSGIQAVLNSSRDKLFQSLNAETRFQEEKNLAIEEIKKKISAIVKPDTSRLSDLKQQRASIQIPNVRDQDRARLLAEIGGVNTTILGLPDTCPTNVPSRSEAEIRTELDELNTRRFEVCQSITEHTIKIDSARKIQDSIRAGHCPTCYRPLSESEATKIRSVFEEHIQSLSNREAELRHMQEAIVQRIADLDAQLDTLDEYSRYQTRKKLEASLASLQAELQSIEEKIGVINLAKSLDDEISDIERKITNYEKDLASLNDMLNERIQAKSPYADMIDSLRAEISNLEQQLVQEREQLSVYKRELDVAEFWVVGFGRTGIKSLLLDRSLTFLEQRTNDYLSAYGIPNLEVRISAVSQTKGGEARERISILPVARAASKSLSGGESRRLDIALVLALGDLIDEFSVDPVRFRILDEVFDYLDTSGVESTVELLSMKSIKSNLTIFVITHNDALKDLFPTRISVTKKNDVSYACFS